MPVAASRPTAEPDLVELSREATAALDALLADAVAKVRERVVVGGKADGRLFDREQRATHGLAWLATYVEAVRQLAAYTERMVGAGTLGEIEENLVRIALGEYLAQIVGGIPMSQGELVRPSDLGLSAAQVAARFSADVQSLIASGNTVERRARLIELMRAATTPRSACAVSTKPWNRSARKCANSPTARRSATPRAGIAPTAIFRSKLSGSFAVAPRQLHLPARQPLAVAMRCRLGLKPRLRHAVPERADEIANTVPRIVERACRRLKARRNCRRSVVLPASSGCRTN